MAGMLLMLLQLLLMHVLRCSSGSVLWPLDSAAERFYSFFSRTPLPPPLSQRFYGKGKRSVKADAPAPSALALTQ